MVSSIDFGICSCAQTQLCKLTVSQSANVHDRTLTESVIGHMVGCAYKHTLVFTSCRTCVIRMRTRARANPRGRQNGGRGAGQLEIQIKFVLTVRLVWSSKI